MSEFPLAMQFRAWIAAVRGRLPHREPMGMRYALRILVSTLAVWEAFRACGVENPIWAVISSVMVSEVEPKATWDAVKSRMAHEAVGCAVGLAFIAAFGTGLWQMSVAAAIASLISFYFVHLGGNWRTAPVASVIVTATGAAEFSKYAGIHAGLVRTAEVLGGSLVALAVSWAAQRLWAVEQDVAERV